MVLLGGLRSWRRDLRQMAPAFGSLTLVLVLCGALAMVALPLSREAQSQERDASVLTVYLSQTASSIEIRALKERLVSDPRVLDVHEVTSAEALEAARRRPGLGELAGLADGNPFPASLDVRLTGPGALAGVAADVEDDPAVDPAAPTSYDAEGYAALTRVVVIVAAIAGSLALLMLGVLYAIVANAIRGVAQARREELTLMRLLGARGWMLRGPFVVEGVATGAFAGALAAVLLLGVSLLGSTVTGDLVVSVLPGLGTADLHYLLASVMSAGIALGGLVAFLGLPRVRA